MTGLRLISVSALVLSVFLGITAYVYERDVTYPARSYRIIFNETDFSSDGLPRHQAVRVRWVTATGYWKELRTAMKEDGSVRSHIIFSKREGQFIIDGDGKSLRPAGRPLFSPAEFRSTAFLRRRPGFVGESQVAELPAFAFRTQINPNELLDIYYSPQTGSVPIKTVFRDENGGRHVVEAVQIQFEAMNEDMLNLPDLPIKLDSLEKDIASSERAGHYEEAETLRQMMKEWEEKLRKQEKPGKQ